MKNKNIFSKNGAGSFRGEVTREASPEETHWLEECIKFYDFVSYIDVMQTFPKSYTSFPKELIHLLKQLKLV